MREKQLILQFINYTSRITPAYAGKTHTLTYAPSLDQDHPRVCGKNCVWFIFMLDKPGSPPHMREKPCQNNKDADCTGITPACAGKTCKRMYSHHLEWDHPRVCGKNKHESQFNSCIQDRIIPACAGKTSSALICLSWSWDHPRVCGKNISDILKMVRVLGSPPLLREKRISTPFVQVNCGITPACAGKTFDSIWECQSC